MKTSEEYMDEEIYYTYTTYRKHNLYDDLEELRRRYVPRYDKTRSYTRDRYVVIPETGEDNER